VAKDILKDQLDRMATSTVSWPWLYQPQPEDSAELKEAHKDLIEDEADLADLDFTTEEFQNTVDGCIAYIAEKVINESSSKHENILEVNYNDQTLKLPGFVATLHSVDPLVKAKDIRHVSTVTGTQEGIPCDDQVVRLSIWIPLGRGIVNIYVHLPSVKDSLMLAHSVSKMMYEACGKAAARLEKFCLVRMGAVSVSECSVEERDARDKFELEKTKKKNDGEHSNGVNGTLEADAAEKKEGKEEADGGTKELDPLPERKMFFTLDMESLCLFDHPLSPKPVWDFRFYKESVEKAIDVIYVCNMTGQLEIEQQQKVFYISSAVSDGTGDKNFEYLSDTLRKGAMKPKPQEIFTDLVKFVDFFKESKPSQPKPKKPDSSTPSTGDQHFSAPPPSQTRGEDVPKWLVNLQTGSHLQSSDEDLQILWFGIEHELQECCRENLIPEPNIDSAGLNPNSSDQLLTAVEDIKDKLLNRNFPVGLSLLHGTMKIYRGTLLQAVAHLDEVEMLKRIFFLSG